jgi:hypothetical protein
MDGWQVNGEATEYDGRLVKGDEVKVACECREDKNSVTSEVMYVVASYPYPIMNQVMLG